MIKTKLAITALTLFLATAQTMAEPTSISNCCQPQPVGGIEALEANTFYPLLEKAAGNNANVILNFDVDVQGNISNIRVAQSGGSMFDKSAIMAVNDTEWSPAMHNGEAVAVTFSIPFEYRTN